MPKKLIHYLIPLEIFMLSAFFFPMYKSVTKLPGYTSDGTPIVIEKITTYTGFRAMFDLDFMLVGNIIIIITFLCTLSFLILQVFSLFKNINFTPVFILIAILQIFFISLFSSVLFYEAFTYVYLTVIVIHFLLLIYFYYLFYKQYKTYISNLNHSK